VIVTFETASPVFLLVLAAALTVAWRRGFPAMRILCLLVFLLYLAGVVAVTFFPFILESDFVEAMRRETHLVDGINVVPLKGLGMSGEVLRQAFLNLLLGIPFGLGMPFLRVPARRSLVYGAIFAFLIELIQLCVDFAYGFAYRTVDINDALLNFTGVVIGIGLFSLTRWLYGRLRLSPADVGTYLDSVLRPGAEFGPRTGGS